MSHYSDCCEVALEYLNRKIETVYTESGWFFKTSGLYQGYYTTKAEAYIAGLESNIESAKEQLNG